MPIAGALLWGAVAKPSLKQWHTAAQRKQERDITRGFRQEYKRAVVQTREQEQKIKKKKGAKIRRASETCKTERKDASKAVSAKCATRRSDIRHDAEVDVGKQKAKREEKRLTWLWSSGSLVAEERGTQKYSQVESDSIALHNIPSELHALFRKTRKQWSYTMQPDRRAEAFLQYVQKEPAEVMAWRVEHESKKPLAYARDYEKHLRARGEWLEELEEAVPF